jgi:hypothetical protein
MAGSMSSARLVMGLDPPPTAYEGNSYGQARCSLIRHSLLGVDAVWGIMQQSLFGMSAQNQRRYIDEQSKRNMLVLNSHFADYRARYKRG